LVFCLSDVMYSAALHPQPTPERSIVKLSFLPSRGTAEYSSLLYEPLWQVRPK